jgi:dihydrolipoamide dehydrogenase
MYDLLILGGGPGGYVAAERAGAAGLRTALVERADLGGTCLNRGCIPTKSLLHSAKAFHYAKDSSKFGVVATDVGFDLPKAMAWKNEHVGKLRQGIAFLMNKHKVEVIVGTGVLASPTRVRISETGAELEAKRVIIATGSIPSVPPIPGVRGNPACLTSDELLSIETLPRSLAVIGGGVIGMEFASFFSTLGVSVTVIEMLDEILPFMDREAVGILKRSFKGVRFALGAKVESIEGGTVRYSTGDATETVEAERILIATGRKPVVDGIGLDAIGVAFDRRGIAVDESMRTNVEGVYAIGDVTGRSQLAHSAEAMGRVAVDSILGTPARIRWDAIPWVVYSYPEAAGVGLTEDEAKAKGVDYVKATIPARSNGRFLVEQGITGNGCAKLIAEKATGRLLGATIVEPYAGETVWGLSYAISNDATIRDLCETVFPHPTASELLLDAAKEIAHSIG